MVRGIPSPNTSSDGRVFCASYAKIRLVRLAAGMGNTGTPNVRMTLLRVVLDSHQPPKHLPCWESEGVLVGAFLCLVLHCLCVWL